MASVKYDDVSCVYAGASRPSVDGLDLDIADGEFLVLVGPSGCGKSTTLRMLAGLEPVSSGSILIDGSDVTGVSPKDRDIAMVFQNYALYPHMTVGENMAFSLKVRGVGKAERVRRVREAAGLLGLEELLDRKPKALSGGQRQRVAMGRAIVRDPKVFLMDEPLSNLDAKLRVQTRTQILKLTKGLGVTTVYVTHDQTEAMTMGDRVAVLNEGVLQQVAPPTELYDDPANLFVAGFIGSPAMNLLRCRVDGDVFVLGGERFDLPSSVAAGLDGVDQVIVGVRAEHVTIDGAGVLPLDVDIVEELGSDAFVYGRLANSEGVTNASGPDAGGAASLVLRAAGRQTLRGGDATRVSLDPAHAFYFHPNTQHRLK